MTRRVLTILLFLLLLVSGGAIVNIAVALDSAAAPPLSGVAPGAEWKQQVRIKPAEWGERKYSVRAVSLSGDRMLIAANVTDPDDRSGPGMACVYRFDGSDWIAEGVLDPGPLRRREYYGFSADISGPVALVGCLAAGAPWPVKPPERVGPAGPGAVFVFRHGESGWAKEARLAARDGQDNDHFGESVCVDGDRAVVGMPHDDENGDASGSAYVFRFDGTKWVQEARLLPDDGEKGDAFGHDVAISGTTILVSARNASRRFLNSGAGYVFRLDGGKWTQEARLVPAEAEYDDWFAESVALCGDRALIGASSDDTKARNAGAAYVFRFDGSRWVEETKLLPFRTPRHHHPAIGTGYGEFGSAVCLSAGRAVIGAGMDNERGSAAGSVSVFRSDDVSWVKEAKLLPRDGAHYGDFGGAVAISGDSIVVGTAQGQFTDEDTGGVYVYTLRQEAEEREKSAQDPE
jgi:hypothetical protein